MDYNIVGILAVCVFLLVCSIIWYIYFFSTKFTKTVVVADKLYKSRQEGSLYINQDGIYNSRRTVEDYILIDTNRNVYNVSDCYACGFFVGASGKYSSAVVGDRIQISGYGGKLTGVPWVYSIKHVR
jgi:hypothetical protein